MKKGEKAVLTCLPEYGYGKHGSPPKIPGNATLLFEVELISWSGSGDLTGDGGIVRKTLKRGTSGGKKPSTGSEVSVHYVGKLPEGKVFATTRDQGGILTFIVDQDVGVPALFHKTVTHMAVGDVFSVTVQPAYGFGAAGNPGLGVPPNSVVIYEIELLESFEREELHAGVVKKKLKDGSGEDHRSPKDSSEVTVKVVARAEGAEPFLAITEATKFTLGSGDLPEAVEKGNTHPPPLSLPLDFSDNSLCCSRSPRSHGHGRGGQDLGLRRRVPFLPRGEPEEGHPPWPAFFH